MDAYQALGNAVIAQAANDYRKAAKFLKKHPRADELEADVAAQFAEKKKRREGRKKLNLPKEREKKSKEERLLDSIRTNEQMAMETARFFRSKWFSCLTEIDGRWLLARLKKEMEDE